MEGICRGGSGGWGGLEPRLRNREGQVERWGGQSDMGGERGVEEGEYRREGSRHEGCMPGSRVVVGSEEGTW